MNFQRGLFNALRSLPLIRFALMLGGAGLATGGAAWLIALLGLNDGRWPSGEAVAIARINGLTMLGIGCLILIGIVLVALAWGKLDRLNLSIGGNSVEIDFDDGPPERVTTTTTTEVKP